MWCVTLPRRSNFGKILFMSKPRPFVAQAVSKVPRGSTQVCPESKITVSHILCELKPCFARVGSYLVRFFECDLHKSAQALGSHISLCWFDRQRFAWCGGFTYFFIFTPTWGRFPFWLYNIFQMGWKHQLVCMMWMCQFDLFILWLTVAALNGQAARSWFFDQGACHRYGESM